MVSRKPAGQFCVSMVPSVRWYQRHRGGPRGRRYRFDFRRGHGGEVVNVELAVRAEAHAIVTGHAVPICGAWRSDANVSEHNEDHTVNRRMRLDLGGLSDGCATPIDR